MNAVEMDNRGAMDLLSAMTVLAYDDYVNGAILLRHSFYEEKNGVIKLIEVYGRPIDHYRRSKKSEFNTKVRNYTTARMFLEDTRIGDYLLEKAKEDIKKDKHRGIRKSLQIYEGVNR